MAVYPLPESLYENPDFTQNPGGIVSRKPATILNTAIPYATRNVTED